MRLSVIVVSYNVQGHLGLCLDAALAACDRLGDGETELIVFDNASSDGSADWVELNYPKVQVVKSKKTWGSVRETMQHMRSPQETMFCC